MAEAVEPSAQDLNSGTKPVDPRHAIDETKLAAWLEANVEGYAGPLEVRQFKGGQSNPTYQLVTPAKKYVLRRKPPGKLLPSAHAVDREFKVISGLNKASFPVAQAYALCMDEDVIGTIFYVMDMVEGRIFWDSAIPEVSHAERAALFDAMNATIADLHSIDHVAAALGIADEEAYLAAYCRRRGLADMPGYDFYIAFNVFRLAAIFHGIKGRVIRGNASSAQARERVAVLPELMHLAWRQAERAGAR